MSAWFAEAFAHPVTRGIVGAVLAVLIVAAVVTETLARTGRVSPALARELRLRLGSWCVLLPLMLGPVLAGRVATIAAVTVLALLCYREYARATGLFRERLLSAVVVLAILAQGFAALDHWYGFFVALWPLTSITLAVATLPLDRPAGYIQRVALATTGYLLIGVGLAHLGYMANDPGHRPVVLLLLTAVALGDVAAFTFGKLVGGPKLLPGTSPNKTISGSLGSLLAVTAVVALVAGRIFEGTPMAQAHWLVLFGLLVGVAGQAGDLVLSSIKRDLGIKDIGASLPGHGGVLDRFNSLLLVAPAAFHLIKYAVGIAEGAPARLITGAGP